MKESWVYIDGVKTKIMVKEHVCKFCGAHIKYKTRPMMINGIPDDELRDHYAWCPNCGEIDYKTDVLLV